MTLFVETANIQVFIFYCKWSYNFGMQSPCQKAKQQKFKANRSYKIIGFESVLDYKYQRRLMELGFFYGQSLLVLKSSQKKQTFLVCVGGVVYCLQQEILNNIVVVEI